MSKKLKVTKIILESGNKKVELSLNEAKDLYDQLNELFGSKETYIPPQPIIIEPDRWRYPWQDRTWCSTTGKAPDAILMSKCDSGLSLSYCGEEFDKEV